MRFVMVSHDSIESIENYFTFKTLSCSAEIMNSYHNR
jgi:hypothetical protein